MKKSLREWKNNIKKLQDLMQQLPTKSDVLEFIETLDELIKFLSDLKDKLQFLPTFEEASLAKDALQKIDEILDRNPLLQDILLGQKVQKKSIKRIPKEQKDVISHSAIVHKLFNLPIDNLFDFLNSQGLTNKELRKILQELGDEPPSRMTKMQLINRIVTIVTNQRTYDGLRER